MKTTTFIYCITDPRPNINKIYIGKSDNPKARLNNHFYESGKYYSSNWFKKLKRLGYKKIMINYLEILDEVPISEWQFWEKHYISLYKTWGFHLTNTNDGGFGSSGRPLSKEAKIKIGKASSARMMGNNHASKWSEKEILLLKKSYSNSTIQELNILFPDRKNSAIYSKAKILKLKKTKKFLSKNRRSSDETKKKRSNSQKAYWDSLSIEDRNNRKTSKGKTKTEADRKNISEKIKNWWKNKRPIKKKCFLKNHKNNTTT